jgi:Leucine-rich repeat (LRR) protein
MSDYENQLIPSGKQPLVKVSKTLAITNKLLNEIESREPNDDFRVSIPDEAFQYFLYEIFGIKIENGFVTYGQIKNIESINCSNYKTYSHDYFTGDILNKWDMSIDSLEGISYFKSLTYLDCSRNNLSNLDLSKNTELRNLICSYNNLSSLNISKNSKLEQLECINNSLTILDVLNNRQLYLLHCNLNKLTSLDLSNCNRLMFLNCADNDLINLDISKNSNLESLNYFGNWIKNVDTSNNPKLPKL